MNTSFFSKLNHAGRRKERTIEIDGDEFTLRDMSSDMRDAWDADAKRRVKFKGRNPDLNTLQTEGQRAMLVAMTLVNDETGELAFDYTKKEDLEKLGTLSGTLLDKLMDESLDLCGLKPSTNEELEKN